MVGTSAVTTLLPNIQPPGITTGGDPKESLSTNPGSVQPIHSSVERHPTGIHFTGVDDHLISLSIPIDSSVLMISVQC
jgi:hypothetical protein